MCGIFGVILTGVDSKLSPKQLKQIVNLLFRLSESRGKEASGIALRANNDIYVLKEPIASSKLVKTAKYKELFNNTLPKAYSGRQLKCPIVILGHSRLKTNGQSEINTNNQPVVKKGAIGIHNGIIVNDKEIWVSHPALKQEYAVDTESFLSLLQFLRSNGNSTINSTKLAFREIEGSASVAVEFDDEDVVLLATNTGSLYIASSENQQVILFASEKFILQQVLADEYLGALCSVESIKQVKAGTGYLLTLKDSCLHSFSITEPLINNRNDEKSKARITISELYNKQTMSIPTPKSYLLHEDIKQSMMKNWEALYSSNTALKRCTLCLLPATMPYINFDDDGVCSYCRDYAKRGNYLKGQPALEEYISKFRNKTGEPNVLVGFSGGRDSSYGLDYIKNTLRLHPITFTYDWGMVNDLARRNQARVVGKLGIEHIVISADIRKKRTNIRKNLKAWLKRPDLGMVPILMAGDKQFYYYFHKVRKQTGIKLFIFCGGYEGEEGTGLFKYGFCNVTTQGNKNALKRMTGISSKNKLKIMYYYLKQFILNPAYINKSIIDTLFAYYSSYILTDDYLYLFHYLDWDENTILNSIIEKFNWEKETDTIATWRTDDGTAAFYNYIYLTMAGFTEFDIFRSHQIREGKLTREQAFDIVKEENKPRFRSIEWYGQAIDYDMNKAIATINSAKRLY